MKLKTLTEAHIAAKPYLVEPGIIATNRKHEGRDLVHLMIIDGTPHLFTPAVCGPKIGTVRTEWFIGKEPHGRGGLANASELPQEIKDRYRLPPNALVSVSLVPKTYFKQIPTAIW